jgi:ATP-dependent Lhr-like helicase
VIRAFRMMEARGEVRGGRFVAGFDGEQYALADAVTLLRAVRKRDGQGRTPVVVSAADPLNFQGILTPEERVSPVARRLVPVG